MGNSQCQTRPSSESVTSPTKIIPAFSSTRVDAFASGNVWATIRLTSAELLASLIELEDARLDQIDVEGLLGFAEYVLTNAARLWMEATAEQRPRLQRALFPEGLRLTRRNDWNRRNVHGLHAVTNKRRPRFTFGVPRGNGYLLHGGVLATFLGGLKAAQTASASESSQLNVTAKSVQTRTSFQTSRNT